MNPMMDMLRMRVGIGRLRGVRVYLHILFLGLLAFSALSALWSGEGILGVGRRYRITGAGAHFVALIDTLLFWGMVFGSVLWHELGHCRGARKVGGDASEITLWPLGGLAMVSGAELGPREEFIVTWYGPLVNLALLAVAWPVWFLLSLLVPLAPPFLVIPLDALDYLCLWFAGINTALAVFNLCVPLFPMDSARLIRSALSFHYHPNRVNYWVCGGGMYLGGAMVLFGLVANAVNLALIGIFGAMYSWQHLQMGRYSAIYLNDGYFYSAANRGFWGFVYEELFTGWRLPRIRMPRRKRRAPSGGATVIDVGRPPRGETKLDRLRREMQEAVAREDFREAARLRDEITKAGG